MTVIENRDRRLLWVRRRPGPGRLARALLRRTLLTCCALAGLVAVGLAQQDVGTPPVVDEPQQAAPVVVPPASDKPTEESVQARLATLQNDSTLDDARRVTLTETWTQVLTQLRQAAAFAAQRDSFAKKRDDAPADLEARRKELASEPVPEPLPAADAPLADLEAALTAGEAAVKDAENKVAELSTERANRTQRRTDIPRQATAARERLTALTEPEGEPAADTRERAAQRVLVQVTREALETEIASYERERESYEARTELLAAREDLATRRLSAARARAESLRVLVNAGRERARKATEAQAKAARVQAASAHPALAQVLQAEARLLEQRSAAAAQAHDLRALVPEVHASKSALEQSRDDLLDRVKRMGLTAGVASLLRRERASLPDAEPYRRSLARHEQQLAQIELDIDDLDALREELSDQEAYVEALLAEHGAPADADELEALRSGLLAGAERLRTLTDQASSEATGVLDALVDLDNEQQQLLKELSAYSRYLEENALWIRNAPVIGPGDLTAAGRELGRWLDPALGTELVTGLLEHLQDTLAGAVLVLLSLLLLFGLRPRARRALAALGARAQAERVLPPRTLLETVAWTLVLAAGLPVLLGLLGTLLSDSVDAVLAAFGDGLVWASLCWWPASLLGAACLPGGLAEAQLRWSQPARRRLRRVLPLTGLLASVLVVLARVLDGAGLGDGSSPLARLALAGVLLTLAAAPVSLLRPGGAILRDLRSRRPDDRVVRLIPLGMVLAAATPLGLLGLLLAGYQDAATQLTRELLSSWCLVTGVVVLHGVANRWLVMERRRARLESARQAREAAAAAATATSASASGDELAAATAFVSSEAALANAPDHDLVDAQARRLLGVGTALALLIGLWLIWSDTLPAFAPLQRYALWEVSSLGEDGATTLVGVTLEDLLSALLVFVLTIVAARNLPGLMDVAIFRQLGLDPSMAYALSTVLRYAVTTAGLLLVCAAIRIQWDQVQWLVAAMGLGLGFGLQEIFGNFVSGLILLFEQRIRVGDVVTVGNVSGVVLRIRVLATTVREWDRKEFVVPNKDLVTGTLLNWTLSDSVNRIKIDVGVAYGSPTEKARQLLMDVARAQPNVLADPGPVATFESFGDSALGLSLRCFIIGLDERLLTITRLHEAIDGAFKKAGIEIAFPQQDLHVRSWAKEAMPSQQAQQSATPSGAAEAAPAAATGQESPRRPDSGDDS